MSKLYINKGTPSVPDWTLIYDSDMVVDEDDMTSNSATLVPTQQSTKAYVDAHTGDTDDAHDATAISVSELGTATYDDVQDYMNFMGERTKISGLGLTATNPADGTIVVAAGTAWAKETNSDTAVGKFFDFAGATAVALTDETDNFVFLDYNTGTPQVVISTVIGTYGSQQDHILLGSVYRSGTATHIVSSFSYIAAAHKLSMRTVEKWGVDRISGMVTTSTGTRQLIITAGVAYRGIDRVATEAFNTATGSTFTYWYYDGDLGGGADWVEVATQTAIDNTQYNDVATGLATLTANRYGVHWVYMDYDGDHFQVLYGQGDYTAALAELASVPASLPNMLTNYCVLIAKIIVQKSSDTLIITYPWSTVFTSSLATDHGSLAGLTDDDHTQYFLLAGETTDAKLYSGADLIVYSDAGSTEKARIDGATGSVTTPKVYLFDAGGEHIAGDGTDMTLSSGATINLTATTDVVIPANVGVTFGTGEKIEGDNTDLTVTSGGAINLTATTDVVIPANVGVTFGTGEKIEGDSTDLTVTSGGAINLTATTDVVIPANVGITFGTGEKIEGDSTDLTVTSGAKINLTATSDVVVPVSVGIILGDGAEKIESDNTDLTINSGADINLTATADVNIPANIGVTFGDDGEKIEGDGTDLTITSSGKLNLNSTGVITASNQGIADNAVVTIDAADVADNDYAKFTANGLEGRSYAEVLADIGASAGSVATDAIWDAKGDLAVGTGANTASKLTVGANGTVLTADSGEATGLKWAAAGSGAVATDAIWDAAGDLAVGSGANTAARLAVGAEDTILMVQSGTPAWVASAAAAEISAVVAAGAGTADTFARSDHVHAINHAITDNHILTIDDASAADDDLCYFTANGIEGVAITGTTIPAAGKVGRFFCHAPTGRKIIYYDDGTNWNPVISLGTMTLYVDNTDGEDTLSTHGQAVDGDAFKTVQFAINCIPPIFSGNVTININAEAYAEDVVIRGKQPSGNYTISVIGTLTTGDNLIASGAGHAGATTTQAYWTDTGLTANAYDNELIKFTSGSNDGLYRIVDVNTTTKITLCGTALTATPANLDTATTYTWGTTVTSFTLTGQRAVMLDSLYINSSVFGLTVTLGSSCRVDRCKFDTSQYCVFVNYQSSCEIYYSYMNPNTTFGYEGLDAAYTSSAYLSDVKIKGTTNASFLVKVNCVSFVYITHGCVLDTAYYGVYMLGNSQVVFYCPDVYNVIKNCNTKGVQAEAGAQGTNTAWNSYSGNGGNENAVAAQFAYID